MIIEIRKTKTAQTFVNLITEKRPYILKNCKKMYGFFLLFLDVLNQKKSFVYNNFQIAL